MFGSLSAYSCQYALEGWLAVPVDVNWRTKEKLVSEDAPSDTVHWSRCRATMAWCLDAALSVGGTGRKPHLLPEEIREASWLFDTFLLAYSHAASRFHGMGICVYKLRPKMHYTQHMVSELSFNKLNFYHAANFLDEDHVKCFSGSSCKAMLVRRARRSAALLSKRRMLQFSELLPGPMQ